MANNENIPWMQGPEGAMSPPEISDTSLIMGMQALLRLLQQRVYESNPTGQVPEFQVTPDIRFFRSGGEWYPVFGVGSELSSIRPDGTTGKLAPKDLKRIARWDDMSEKMRLQMISDLSKRLIIE